MSWLFSRALVEGYLAANCLDGEPCAPLNVMPTQHPFWHRDKTTDFLNHFLFGRMSAHLTESLGAGLLTWFRAGFPARTSAPPEREPELKAREADFGWKWPGSLAKYDPLTSSWKTRQCSLLGGLDEFSETWPRWGSMRNGELLPLPTLVPRTSVNEFGLWPTPCTPNGGRTNRPDDIATKGLRPDGRKVQISLESAAKNWSTPLANDAEKRGDFDAWNPRNGLAGDAKRWSTPRASDGEKGGPNQKFSAGGQPLAAQAAQWATPTARDHFPPHSPEYITKKRAQGHGMRNLNDEAALHGIPGKSSSDTTERPGSLNPEFHLWLMGWPIGWTALEPLETDKYRSAPPQLGGC